MSFLNSFFSSAMLFLLVVFCSCSSETASRDDLTSQTEPNQLVIDTKGDSLLKHPKGEPYSDYRPYYHLSLERLDNSVYYTDTVVAHSSEDLIEHIGSNRVIRLLDMDYVLESSKRGKDDLKSVLEEEGKQGLLIDGIKNLRIIGSGSSRLLADEGNANVLTFLNCHNIHLDNLTIARRGSSVSDHEQGVLRAEYCYNVTIDNSTLIGEGTFGLVTNVVYNLSFLNSEITECSKLIFDLERSRKFQFENSKFHNNRLSTSVLGGFTNASSEVSFANCEFIDNTPDLPGNPAFNQHDIYEPVLFTSCKFRNNKGFKWYSDYVVLVDCEVLKGDFIGYP